MEFLQKLIEKFLIFQRKRKSWYKVIRTLECITVAVTTYALILPAISLSLQEAGGESGIVLSQSADAEQAGDVSDDDDTVYSSSEQGESADIRYEEPVSDVAAALIEAAPVLTGTIYPESLDLYAEKSVDSYMRASMPQGASVNVLEDQGDGWLFVSTPEGMTGYVKKAYVLLPGETIEEKKPAMTFELIADRNSPDAEIDEAYIDGTFAGPVKIHVEAPVGAFPVGTTMKVRPVAEEQVREAVKSAVPNPEIVSRVSAVDITFFDACGDEVEPDFEIKVSLTSADISAKQEPVVVHVDDEGRAQVVEAKKEEENVVFESDKFSVYVIVGTTIEKTVLASDGLNYRITATYGTDTGIPEEAELSVEEILPEENGDANTFSAYEEYVSKTENALGMEEGSAGYIRLFDIKIVDKDDLDIKYQPAQGTSVDVRIELADKDSSEDAAASTQVVHFHNEEMHGTIIENSTDGQIVAFKADGFSIYAIIDSSKRLQYNFYDGTSLLVSEYIKKQDNIIQELYDPGVEPEYGQTFVGWAYAPDETNPSNIYTIEELNQQAAARYNSATEELTEINVYAIYDEAWYLRYMDEDAEGNEVVLNVVRVRKDAANKNVTINYTFTPEEGIVFEGWMDVTTGQTYQQGDTITLDHHVDLYVKLHGRNWLVFDSNAGGPGSGATYTPPQLLIGDEATTSKPNDPTRRGYTFSGWNTAADGSGTWWYKPDGSVNRFGNTLSSDTTLYAQWEADDTDYYVVFWKQKATATGTDPATDYDYVSSDTRTAKTGDLVSITQADTRKGNYQGNTSGEYGYYFTYNADNSDTVSKVVNPDGTTQLNVYYDRKEITINFTSTNGAFNVTTYTGVVDGETVTLIPDGNGGYTYQKEHTETTNVPYTGTRYNITTVRNNNNPVHYGVVSGRTSPVQLDRRDNDRWYYDGTWNSWGTRYYGTHYVQSSTGTYGWINNTMTQLNADGTYTTIMTTYTDEPYDGPEPIASTTAVTSYTLTGLYGAPLTDWPDAGSGYQWQTSGGSTYHGGVTTFVIPSVVNTTGRQTTWNLVRTSNSGTAKIYFVTMKEDGSYPDDPTTNYVATSVITNTTSMNFAPQKYEGFTGDYVVRNGNTQYFNGSNVSVGGSGDIYVFYKRNQWKINYISEGVHVTERDAHESEAIFYGANISSYGQDNVGNWYYEPDNGIEGYYFAGWYADSSCQIPFDFNMTMPNSDITVYAKWDTYRVRVVLVPTPDNAHNDEVELANNQALSFRLDYNEQVDNTNINSSVAHRPGYKLIGWYYSPDFDPATEVHFPVLINNETPGVDMTYQSGEDWTKYGDNDGSHDNVRGILKLYAKWELDVDERSVYVEYDVDDVYRTYDTAGMLQTTIPVDDNKYALTNNNVTFQVAEAPTEYTSGFEFYRWVLLNPDGSESDILYNPADTASEIPSSFIYEETITDDLGNTATIKKIRLKAKFNIETEKVTTVTFDGNGGVTNDSAQQESVTESYPINKDFLMKEENSFVKEGYTLIGWAFEREDGSKITAEEYKNAIETMTPDELIQAGIYQPRQKVAADNLKVSDENNWDPLENTVYAVWEINTYTVTLKKVVDGENEVEKTFPFTAAADGDYALSTEDSAFALAHGGEKVFAEVPYGTILTFTESAASGYSIQSVVAKQTTMPNKDPLAEADYIDLVGANGKSYTIKGDTVITYTNKKAEEQKLRIHKIGDDDDDASGLAGATFDLKAAAGETIVGFTDMTDLVSMNDTTPSNEGYLPGGDATDETLFTLPIGTYTLTETDSPLYYDGISGAVTLSVTGDGISITSVGNDAEAPFDGVSMSTADEDGVYTLTVTNTRKKASVTVIKNVEGITSDETAEYSFTPTGFNDAKAITLRGSDNESTLEVVENRWATKDTEKIPYGTTISLLETGAADFNTSIVISQNGTNTTLSGEDVKATGYITVTGDVTITYTNTRKVADITLNKVAKGTVTPLIPGAQFRLYRKNSEGIYATDESIDATKEETIHTLAEGTLTIADLPSGDYRLTEIHPPEGYIIEHSDTYFTVNANGTGDVITATTGQQAYSAIGVSTKKTTKDNDTLVIPNTLGAALPATGGSGTHLIYLLGIIFTSLAGAGFLLGRRKRNTAQG